MIEGQSSKAFLIARAIVYQNPKFLYRLLQKLTSLTINYLNAQIRTGIDALMIFDTRGGLLTSTAYEQFSLNYLSQIAVEVMWEKEERRIPLIFFTKNGGQWLEKITTSGCDWIGLDNCYRTSAFAYRRSSSFAR